jgi:hypothetical protein
LAGVFSASKFLKNNGAPGKIRTPDPQIRSLVLYPAELPVRDLAVLMANPHDCKRKAATLAASTAS